MSQPLPTPVQLVCYDHTAKKFIIQPESRRQLEASLAQFPGPVTVVSVIGQLRSGKSFLMNSLYWYPESPYGRGDEGFALGDGVQPVTKGIWAWVRAAPDGRGALLLLDTEGLNDPNYPDSVYDAKVFALSLAVTSSLVINSLTPTVTASLLNDLNHVTEMTKRLKLSTNERQCGTSNFAGMTPRLTFLLRDASLRLVHPDDGRPLASEDELLEAYLNCEFDDDAYADESRMAALQRNATIVQCFPRRGLRRLPKPHADPRVVAHVPEDQIEADFRTGLKRVTLELLAERTPVPMAKNPAMSGLQYLDFLQVVVQAFNDHDVVVLPDALSAAETLAADAAVEAAVAAFNGYMQTLPVPMSDEALLAAEATALTHAKDAVVERAMATSSEKVTELLSRVEARVQQVVRGAHDRNDQAARDQLNPRLEAVTAKLDALMASDALKRPGGAAEFSKAADALVAELEAGIPFIVSPQTQQKVFNGPAGVLAETRAAFRQHALNGFKILNQCEAEAERLEGEKRAAAAERELAEAAQQRETAREAAVAASLEEARAKHKELMEQMKAQQDQRAADMKAQQEATLARLAEDRQKAQAEGKERMAQLVAAAEKQATAQRERQEKQQETMLALMMEQDKALAAQQAEASRQQNSMMQAMMQMQQSEQQATAQIAQAAAQAQASRPSFGQQLLGMAVGVAGNVLTGGLTSALGIGATAASGTAAAAASA